MLTEDIILDSDAFNMASQDMKSLKQRTENLRDQLSGMYEMLAEAMDTPSGHAVEFTAKEVLLKPIEDLILVIQHVSDTLEEIMGTGYYGGIFIKFENLNSSLKF